MAIMVEVLEQKIVAVHIQEQFTCLHVESTVYVMASPALSRTLRDKLCALVNDMVDIRYFEEDGVLWVWYGNDEYITLSTPDRSPIFVHTR